jgi:hypothetical protein
MVITEETVIGRNSIFVLLIPLIRADLLYLQVFIVLLHLFVIFVCGFPVEAVILNFETIFTLLEKLLRLLKNKRNL